jgi:hypothetical protein
VLVNASKTLADLGERVSVQTATYSYVAVCHGLGADLNGEESRQVVGAVGTNNADRSA